MTQHNSSYVSPKRHVIAVGACLLLSAFPLSTSNAQDEEVFTLDAFQVTGTNIRGGEQNTGSKVINFNRVQIEELGVTTTEALLKTNPAMGNFQSLYQGNGDAGGGYVPSIHGIGEGQTLVLVNGHRLPGSGWLVTAADPSVIPASAIERVDIIADGASAIYGSDAVEGVINIILRKDYEGAESTVKYGMGDGLYNFSFNTVYGSTWKDGSLLIGYDYGKSSNLKGSDRSTFYTQDLSSLGGSDYRSTNAYPANISIDGVTYSLPGFDTDTLNKFDVAPYFDIIPEVEKHNLLLALNQQVSEKLTLSAELYYLTRDILQEVPPESTSVTVPDTNPYFIAPPNSSASSVVASYDLTNDLGYLYNTTETDVYSIAAGAALSMANDWRGTLDITHGWSEGVRFQPIVNQNAVAEAAMGTTLETALNPFGIGATTSDSVLALLPTSVNVAPETEQTTSEATLKFDGPIFETAAGQAQFAIGTTYRKEGYDSISRSGELSNPLVGVADIDRTIYSVFGEMLIPLIDESNSKPGFDSLSLSLAARYDDYDDFGDTTNPKAGITWTPFEGLDLRASYGTSFHAPRLSDIGVGVDTRLIPIPAYFLGGYYPPSAPRMPNNSIIIAGGSEGLEPEKATTYTFGFDFVPQSLPRFHFSASYYDILFEDKVDVVFAPNFYNPGDDRFYLSFPTEEEALALIDGIPLPPGAIIFEPIEYIGDVRRYNLGNIWSSGIDFEASYSWNTEHGTIETGLSGNYVLEYDVQQTDGAPITDSLDTETSPGLKLRAHLSYTYDRFGLHLFANRTDSYYHTSAQHRVGDYTTLDLHLNYEFKKGWLEQTRIGLDVSNLLDEEPPFVNQSQINNGDGSGVFGFDRLNASPIGRVISLSASHPW
ncbi:TonB-dependent receptor plug domain-containing protein [Pelagicoccus albus]|uniref:TonB-dependent receptor n=1 Tax=Pelagicoccus albus TaxID=415222 RepID=A0A7X1BAC9_9BACT|nr:TonB-dependent receptor [Pelagicoccus albus]MBC2607275.1 TonB-dependent receptor [Pelagicoccus albus]